MSADLSQLTEEEEQVYDRQIRLWGMDAQNRLKNSKILIIGVNGVSCEVIKNLVLTGINRIGLCDELNVTEEDIDNNFLIERTSLGENRAVASRSRTEILNPRVTVDVFTRLPLEIVGDGDGNMLCIDEFDIVVCCTSWTTSIQGDLWTTVNDICRSNGKLFFAMNSFGWHGLTFVDLNRHEYLREEHELQKAGEKATGVTKFVPDVKQFFPLTRVMGINWSGQTKRTLRNRAPQFQLMAMHQFVREHRRYAADGDIDDLSLNWAKFAAELGIDANLVPIEEFRHCIGAGVVPVNAVLGGLVTQEIIKAISRKKEPVGNFLFFNGILCSADSTFITPTD